MLKLTEISRKTDKNVTRNSTLRPFDRLRGRSLEHELGNSESERLPEIILFSFSQHVKSI